MIELAQTAYLEASSPSPPVTAIRIDNGSASYESYVTRLQQKTKMTHLGEES